MERCPSWMVVKWSKLPVSGVGGRVVCLLMTNSCGKTTLNRLQLHPGSLSATHIILIIQPIIPPAPYSKSTNYSFIQRDQLTWEVSKCLAEWIFSPKKWSSRSAGDSNPFFSKAQKTEWVVATAADKFIMSCYPPLLANHSSPGLLCYSRCWTLLNTKSSLKYKTLDFELEVWWDNCVWRFGLVLKGLRFRSN